MTGSRKWPATAWRHLLDLALRALDAEAERTPWTFGGGTALALKLQHRISYDVDIFFEDAGLLRRLSPQRNAITRAMTGNWREPGNYLKLELDEGAIDFIAAATVTDLSPWTYRFHKRAIAVEAPGEIIAKKLRYRGSLLPVRDIFDILALAQIDGAALEAAVAAAAAETPRAIDRIERLAGRYRETIAEEVNPTNDGAALLDIDPLAAAKALQRALRRL